MCWSTPYSAAVSRTDALVRLGESFLYADVLAARKPDVATADRLQQAVVYSSLPPPPRRLPG
jgi:hypothetical protein